MEQYNAVQVIRDNKKYTLNVLTKYNKEYPKDTVPMVNNYIGYKKKLYAYKILKIRSEVSQYYMYYLSPKKNIKKVYKEIQQNLNDDLEVQIVQRSLVKSITPCKVIFDTGDPHKTRKTHVITLIHTKELLHESVRSMYIILAIAIIVMIAMIGITCYAVSYIDNITLQIQQQMMPQ